MAYDKDVSPFMNLLARSVLLLMGLACLAFIVYDHQYESGIANTTVAGILVIMSLTIVLVKLLCYWYDGSVPDWYSYMTLGICVGTAIRYAFT